MVPSKLAIQASCGMELASARKSSSLWRKLSSAALRSLMSWIYVVKPSLDGKMRTSSQRPSGGYNSSKLQLCCCAMLRRYCTSSSVPGKWGQACHRLLPASWLPGGRCGASMSAPRVLM